MMMSVKFPHMIHTKLGRRHGVKSFLEKTRKRDIKARINHHDF